LDVDVSDIIISHWHHDHVGGLPGVLGLLKELWDARNPGKPYPPPRIHKHPFPASATKGHHHSHYNQLPRLLKELPQGLFFPPGAVSVGHTIEPAKLASSPEYPGVLHPLSNNQLIRASHGTTLLQVLHTPGHTADSICLYIPQDRALYTADTVLGHGTAVFEDLAMYLASLNRMLSFGADENKDKATADDTIDLAYVSLYPAHGAVVADGRETIATYIKHRLEREAQIVGVLNSLVPAELAADSSSSAQEASGSAPLWSTWNIVRVLYKSYPENLWLPAARGVDLHLRKLEGDGLVKLVVPGGEGEEHNTVWRLLISPPGTPSL
jgi:ribonuclease/clavin/mitogillin